jgi:DNA-binding response OmpR family regulator
VLNKVWGYHSEIETRAADDTVKRLRKKIVDTNVSIETVWGFGFRLKENS